MKVKTEPQSLTAVMMAQGVLRTPTATSSDVRPLQSELCHVQLTEACGSIFNSSTTNNLP